MVWLGIVWIGFEWYGAWVFSRCSSMQNLTPSLKIKRVMDDVRYLVWYGQDWFCLEWYGAWTFFR